MGDMKLVENPLALLTSRVDVAGLKLLDIGCGDGANLDALSAHGADVVGVEPSPRDGTCAHEIIKAGAEKLPFGDNHFDVVCFFYSLHHVPTDVMDKGLGEVHRVLRPGGKLYVIDPRPSGSLYDLIQPIDDEAFVQKQAHATLQTFVAAGDFDLVWDDNFVESYDYAEYDDYRADMLSSNSAREILFDKLGLEQFALFQTLGEPVDEKMRFYQAAYACLLTKVER